MSNKVNPNLTSCTEDSRSPAGPATSPMPPSAASSTSGLVPSPDRRLSTPIIVAPAQDKDVHVASSTPGHRSPPPPVPYVSNPYSIFTVTVKIPAVFILTNTSAPTLVECPHCLQTVTTITTTVAGRRTCLLAVVLITVCCLVGAVLLVYLWEDSKDVIHSCPACLKQLARHRPSVAGRGPARYLWRHPD